METFPVGRAGLIFDFDGTIALSEPVHIAAWDDVATASGRRLPDGFHRHGVGQPDDLLSRQLAAVWTGGPDAATLLQRKREAYLNRSAESILVPGIEAMLSRFYGRLPLGLATSASLGDITPTMERHGLGRFFDVVLTVESVTNPKPHPEIYLLAAERLGIEPPLTTVFEDSPAGATAARAAGMRVIGLTTTFPPAVLGALAGAIMDYRDLTVIEALLAG
jgi:beta-phosphoglucomutase-like phosphatase (HAD superfamily)